MSSASYWQPNSNLLPLEHDDYSVLSAIYAFPDSIDFSFVYILHLGDDLWPHLREGSEKPITKGFPALALKSGWSFWKAGINRVA